MSTVQHNIIQLFHEAPGPHTSINTTDLERMLRQVELTRALTQFDNQCRERLHQALQAEERLRKAAALTISIDRYDRRFGDEWAVQVMFHPHMFIQSMMLKDPSNLSFQCDMVGRDLGEKVAQALMKIARGGQ